MDKPHSPPFEGRHRLASYSSPAPSARADDQQRNETRNYSQEKRTEGVARPVYYLERDAHYDSSSALGSPSGSKAVMSKDDDDDERPVTRERSFPLPSPQAELASYRFGGEHAEEVVLSTTSPRSRSSEGGSNVNMDIDADSPTGFHSTEDKPRGRIRPW